MSTIDVARKSRLPAWAALLLYLAVFVAIYAGVHAVKALIEPHLQLETPRDKTAFAAASSIVLLWCEFAAMLIVLRLRGQRLADLGWRKRASVWGWLSAIALVVAYAGFLSAGPLAKQPMLTDWSLFRIATAVGIGITAGICEEAIFRGFVMTQARDAGMPVIVQIALSAILFGLAHVGWGALTGSVNMAVVLGSVAATAILGALLATVYVIGRRSLMPAIAAHGAIDLVIEPWLMLAAFSGGLAAGQ